MVTWPAGIQWSLDKMEGISCSQSSTADDSGTAEKNFAVLSIQHSLGLP